jgi:hypothetical protein
MPRLLEDDGDREAARSADRRAMREQIRGLCPPP